MGHHRCYRNKATERFLLLGRSGIELLDVKTGQVTAHHYVRGACQYGIFPANGLIYVPSHSCACFIQAKLNGFNALAPKGNYDVPVPSIDEKRLQRGPAFNSPRSDSRPTLSQWPTYRRDTHEAARPRTGRRLRQLLNSNCAADSSSRCRRKLFVAQWNRTSHALMPLAARQPDLHRRGRIDSPPRLRRMCAFGSADGCVLPARRDGLFGGDSRLRTIGGLWSTIS
jgi:hypothetical protein